MAQKIQAFFIDDIDGSEADGTVRFSLDDVKYEIDLSKAHADSLRLALKEYIGHARKTASVTGKRAARGASGVDTAKVREWARATGISIKDRGRVPAAVVEQYKAATAP